MAFSTSRKVALALLKRLPVFVLAVLAAVSFSAWHALWLVGLATVTAFRPAWGTLLLFLAIPVDRTALVAGRIFVNFSEFQFGTVFLVWTAGIWPGARRDTGLDWRALRWGSAFSTAVLLSGLVHNEWYRVVPHTLRMSGLVLACFLAANAFRNRSVNACCSWLVALGTLWYAGWGLLEFPFADAGRTSSFFTNANQFAGYLNLLLPFILVHFFTSAGRKIRMLWALLAIGLLAALATTQSRSGWVAALITAAFLWWLHYGDQWRDFWRAPGSATRRFLRRSGPSLAAGLLTVCLAGLLVASIPQFQIKMAEAGENLQRRSARGFWGGIENGRLPFFRVGLEMWKDHWLLGIGPGNHRQLVRGRYNSLVESYWYLGYYEQFRRAVAIHVHNLYLQLAVSLGLAGLTGFLYLVRMLLKTLWMERNRLLPLAGLGLLTSFLVHNLMDVTFPSLGLEAGLLLGLALTGTEPAERRQLSSASLQVNRPA